MTLKILCAGGLALAVTACSPFAMFARGPATGELATGSITPALTLSTGIATATPTPGHVDAPGSAPHSHDGQKVYGEPGNPAQPARTVEIAMSETDDGRMIFTPASVQANAGEQVLFKLRNTGALEHEFVLATHEENLKHGAEMQKNPDMEHDDPNAVRLAPGKEGEILWKFTNSGGFEFACLVPGHRESGMFGTVVAMN